MPTQKPKKISGDNFLEKKESIKNIIDSLESAERRNAYMHGMLPFFENRRSVRDEIEMARAQREHLKNQELGQDIALKKITLRILFIFLGLETVIIFAFAFFQAVGFVFKFDMKFHLEEWSFKLLVFATISQITYMVQLAVKHLFPNKK